MESASKRAWRRKRAIAVATIATVVSAPAFAEWSDWKVTDTVDPLTDDGQYFAMTTLTDDPPVSIEALVMVHCLAAASPHAFGLGVGTSGDLILADEAVVSLRIGDDEMMRVPALIQQNGFLTTGLITDEYGAVERLARGEKIAWRLERRSQVFEGGPDPAPLAEFIETCAARRSSSTDE